MPYSADLRCSYASVEMNTAWLYQLFDDNERPLPNFREEYMSTVFETEADKWANDYVKAKVFWTGSPPKDDPDYKAIMNCESVWAYLWEKTQDFLDEHVDWFKDADEPITCDHCDAETIGYKSGGPDTICLTCKKRYDANTKDDAQTNEDDEPKPRWQIRR